MNFTDLACYINKLKVKEAILERGDDEFIKSFQLNYGVNLADEQDSLKVQRFQECNALRKDIQKNFKILKNLKTLISSGTLENIDITVLKNNMLEIESSTHQLKFRVTNDLETLSKIENVLTIEITNIEMKFADINKILFDNTKKNSVGSSKMQLQSHLLYQEVKDFASFVNETGGHEGGWFKNDHLVFIRNYNKIKNRTKLIMTLHILLPDIPEQKISDHIDWYNKYLDLRAKQKDAIEEWRKNKLKLENKSTEIQKQNEVEIKKVIKSNVEDTRQNVKQKLEKWKLEREQKLKEEIENNIRMCSTKFEDINKNAQLKQNIQKEIKKEVQRWRASIKAQKKADNLQKEIIALREKERKVSMAKKLILEFQNQDNMYLIRRLNSLNIKTNSQFTKVTNKETYRNKSSRNPERVYKATKQWISRISHDHENDFKNNANIFLGHMTVKQIPKLGVPTWRLVS